MDKQQCKRTQQHRNGQPVKTTPAKIAEIITHRPPFRTAAAAHVEGREGEGGRGGGSVRARVRERRQEAEEAATLGRERHQEHEVMGYFGRVLGCEA